MIHNEHFRKADETYEIRHNNNGNAIHLIIKDGEAIVFPTAYDLFQYWLNGGNQSIERFYVDEDDLLELYSCDDYDYYIVKAYWLKKHPDATSY